MYKGIQFTFYLVCIKRIKIKKIWSRDLTHYNIEKYSKNIIIKIMMI